MEAAYIKETFKLQDAVKQVSRIVSGCAVHHAHTAGGIAYTFLDERTLKMTVSFIIFRQIRL